MDDARLISAALEKHYVSHKPLEINIDDLVAQYVDVLSFNQYLKMLERIPQLSGMTPWIISDFRSPRRLLHRIQDGWNRKGVFSENGEKKKAFFILNDYYNQKEKGHE